MPTTLSEALDLLHQGAGTVVAGGTDLYPSAKIGGRPGTYVDVTRISELNKIKRRETEISIGAGVTWGQLVASELPSAFDALKQAALEVGSIQIQNAGTLVGNICNASPAADGVPALLALDASVQICSAARGTRTVSLSDFITGVRRKDLAADEIVTGIVVPSPHPDMRSAFEKLGSRRYLVISICMVAVNLQLDESERIVDARVAVGACSAVAKRLETLEQDMLGKRVSDVQTTSNHLATLSPIDDVRGSANYRLDVVPELIRRACHRAATV